MGGRSASPMREAASSPCFRNFDFMRGLDNLRLESNEVLRDFVARPQHEAASRSRLGVVALTSRSSSLSPPRKAPNDLEVVHGMDRVRHEAPVVRDSGVIRPQQQAALTRSVVKTIRIGGSAQAPPVVASARVLSSRSSAPVRSSLHKPM